MKPISSALGPLFANLERRAQETLDLTTKVRESLDGEEREHLVSAYFRGEMLVLQADSAAWASRLHYLQGSLSERLRARGETQFTKVKVTVGRSG